MHDQKNIKLCFQQLSRYCVRRDAQALVGTFSQTVINTVQMIS
jgi:hypothetical protein